VHSGFIVHPTYQIRGGVPVVQLFGRLESGERFLVEDDRFRPYFYVPEEQAEALKRTADARVEAEATLEDLAGRRVVRVEVTIPSRVAELREQLAEAGVDALEADIRFPYRYLIDHGLRSAISVSGEAEPWPGGGLRFVNPVLEPAKSRPRLRTLSIDIETTPDAGRLYSAALVGDEVDEVHLVGDRPVPGALLHADEEGLFRAIAERIRSMDPDVITGWNVIDFDLQVLVRRAGQLGVPFEIGRIQRPLRIERDRSFARSSRAEVAGRQALDGLALVREAAIPLEDFRLETAARTLLGRGKLIDQDAPDPAAEVTRLYRQDPAALVAYNREDARLVLDILEQEGLLELCIERSLLSGMQMDRVGASIASFDLVYLPQLRQRGCIAPSVRTDREAARLSGGAVFDSSPGVFKNVVVFDFKSLYPSLMRTFNLDPLAAARGRDEPDAIVAPNGARLSRDDAILPDILEAFSARREAAKQRGDKHADFAIKIMMNSFYGVLGASLCRFFNPRLANAITGFGQQVLGWTRDAFLEEGLPVLYGDTDSVFVGLDPDATEAEAHEQAGQLLERVQRHISERVAEVYGVEPRLDLELECLFSRFFQPSLRGGSQGSKKRYAGWSEGRLKVVGLEAVRRDWPKAAKRLQLEMLERLFTDQPLMPLVKQTVEDLRNGALDRELVISKGLRKGSTDAYKGRMPPHVEAARRAGDRNARFIRYVLTRRGPEPVGPGRPFPEDIDREHYVDKVLRPVADAILTQVDSSFDQALGIPTQLTLL